MSAPAPANPVFCALDTVDLDAAGAGALIVAVTVLTSLDDGDPPAAARAIAASLAAA